MPDHKATVIYDGDWGLWERLARWVHRKDRGKQLDLIPFQAQDLEERFSGISRERCRQELHLINERNHIFTGAAAARETLARLPGANFTTLPFHTPGGMWVADRVYHWVARNRGRLSRWFA